MQVLVVEDNEFNRQLVVDLLGAHGMTVTAVSSADEAIRVARARCFDVILMDISLRGMDGLEATRRLKADPRTAGVPVVALTAYAMGEDRVKALEAGCAGFIPKPFDTASLVRTVMAYGRPAPGKGE